ncbi:MAG: hypothetical protein OEV14_08430, partial [Gammaproteobacteria bacterium]|nr:hypothetical protein [Gammaproteobacteria bacterium]
PEADFAIDPAYGFASGVMDFEILRVTQGGAARVVIPLAYQAIDGSVYKRFVNGAWQEFSVSGGDLIESASGTDGACPPVGSSAYQPGLLAGTRCLQLKITDGGPNDDDGVVDAVIRTAGGLATPVSARISPVVSRRVTLSGDGEVVAARYRIHSDSGDLEIRSVTIETRGSGDETMIDRISLVVDENRDGVFDDGDTAVADDQLSIDNGMLTLSLVEPYTVQPGDTDLLVVYRFGPPID